MLKLFHFAPLMIALMPFGVAALPGAPPLPPAIAGDVAAAAPVTPPRTQHVDNFGAPNFTNRLILERSPYLRQHAHNPIDWRPWGAAALSEAAARGIPIFLSVGYATCHWCHVMEEESFDDVAVARLLNANFVAIKVDRETLPQIDAQYMLATQLISGSGGWPNNLFLTPEAEPIFSVGYLPRGSFLQALATVTADWADPVGASKMREQAASVSEFVRLISATRREAAQIGDAQFTKAAQTLLSQHDDLEGGFGNAPKFPSETNIRFLLERHARQGDAAALEAGLHSLRAMVAGGLHDQIGGGFHRYTIDSNWRTPHFEKMLYNQALMGGILLQAWQLTGDALFERALRRTLDYVIRDMRAPGGAFFAAQDADSAIEPGGRAEEGAFYTWTSDQLFAALPGEQANWVTTAIGLDAAPTMPTGGVAHHDPDHAPDFARLNPLLEQLRQVRAARPVPITDTKIIAGWNGLIIRTMADAGAALKDPRYLNAAEQAASFLRQNMMDASGGLSRAWSNGALEPGTLRDYAWLGLAHVALYDATGVEAHLATAQRLSHALHTRFFDQPGAPYRLSETPGPLGPSYDLIEGAIPTGNASALELFSSLAQRIAEDNSAMKQEERADALLAALSGSLQENPADYISALTAAATHHGGETGMVRHLGGGAGRASLDARGDALTLTIDLKSAWHANANDPGHPDLIPTSITGDGLHDLRYPGGRMAALGFADRPIRIIEGVSQITARRTPNTERAALTIQICRDDLCLPPEEHVFALPAK